MKLDASSSPQDSCLFVGSYKCADVQDTIDLDDSSDGSSGEGTGGLTASGGNTVPDAASSGGLLAAASVAAPAAAPAGNLTAVTLATDPNLVRPLHFTGSSSQCMQSLHKLHVKTLHV